jgi:hypothetical protein
MVTAFFTVNPSAGNVYGTEFTVNNLTQGNIHRYIWDFSEGELIYDVKTPSFIYKSNGIKTISLTAVDVSGNIDTFSTTVSTDYLYRDYLIFTQIPETFSNPGLPTTTPFKVQVVTSQINQPLYVDLYAANSQSIPHEFVSPRWSFLNPTWYFLDKNKNKISTLPVPSTPIFYNNRVVGASGEADFYFVDSISNGNTGLTPPVLITATLQTSGFNNINDSKITNYPSYSNNETVRAAVLWQVNDLSPSLLKVTSNYLDPIPKQKWSSIKIPFIVSCHGNKSYRFRGANDITSEILFSYPQSNEVGKLQQVLISLSGVNAEDYSIDEEPLYFRSNDANGFRTGGYIFTTLTSHTTAINTAIVAQTTAFYIPQEADEKFPYPAGFAPNSFAWVSNPGHKTLNKITVVPYLTGNTTIDYFKEKEILIDGFIKQIQVPSSTTNSTFNYTMSGISGIYSLVIDPRNNDIIAGDVELDCLYKFSANGVLLSTLQLSSISQLNPVLNAHTPSQISIDENYNIWVSLFNSISVLKFDENFNLLFSVVPSNSYDYNAIYEGDFVFKPPYIETDKYNNCWATYSSPASSLLVQYSPSGDILTQIQLEEFCTPTNIAINHDNNVWISKPYYVTDEPGKIDLYSSTTYDLLSTFDNIFRPDNIVLDRSSNLWFLFGDRRIGHINTTTNVKTTWSVSTDDTLDNPFTQETILTKNEKQKDSTLTGLAVDAYNRVWLLDSLNNNVWVLLASPQFNQQPVRKIKVIPNTPIGYYSNITNFTTYTLPNKQQNLYASGDWTGNKWYQKYVTFQNISAVPVSGISNFFNIEPFTNNYQVTRNNSTFDMANYLQSLALPENLSTRTGFFKEFLGAVVGNSLSSSYQDIGKTIYEKIANFTDYHGDIETCGIEQLLSYADLTQTPILNYKTELPVDIKDFLNIASIPRTKLWGMPDEIPLLSQSTNVTNPLNVLTSFITAGKLLSLRNKFDGKFTVVQVPPKNTTLVYPLSEFLGYGLEQPVAVKHDIFNFEPKYTGEYIESVIDWNNLQTTLSRNLSTFEDWYGDNGAIVNSFNYILTKNIFS